MLPYFVFAALALPAWSLPPGILGDSHGLFQLHAEASSSSGRSRGADASGPAQAPAFREKTTGCIYEPLVRALRMRDRVAFVAAAQGIHGSGCREEDIVQALAPEMERDMAEAASFLDAIFHGDSSSPSLASVRVDTDGARRGETQQDADLAAPPASEDAANSVFFAHIPKNAGTAIEHAGYEEGVVWGRNAFLAMNTSLSWLGGRAMPDNHVCSFHHIPPGQFADPNPYDGRRVFCVTRDPYDRIVSDYRYMTKNAGKWWTPLYWWFGLHMNGMSTEMLCTPMGLNLFVQRSLVLYQQGQRFLNDCHMIPQTEFIWNENMHQWCNDVIPISELSTRFDALMAEIGSNVRLPSERSNNSGEQCPGLRAQDLSDQSVRMIDLVYRDDFEMLGYSFRGPDFNAQE